MTASLAFKDVHEMYYGAMFLVHEDSRYDISPRGQPVRERRDETFVVENPVFEPVRTRGAKRNAEIAAYTEREMRLYREGTLDAARWRDEASKFWWELRNPDDRVNSNYGFLTEVLADAPGTWDVRQAHAADNTAVIGAMTQWEWAKTCLLHDDETRQAVMVFFRPCHQWVGNKDLPCTMHGCFALRDGELHYTVVMRSQDVWRGMPYDVPYFIWQQCEMARQLGARVGNYTHIVHSFHMYERDAAKVKELIR